ncbi:GNAT family N-acetyltransferase [Microbacterium testaceum]|uniref:GNAT family N-acetyltransferase n=1 Tax=Microbacterium testaceum TaxID=2033 RepID=UPI0025B0C242|nr:GNAT family N-acetyltransferase [Microbacterium testaceum]WJS92467.1 GNAT family N-acetyltransferase [Microbacterium testaceum]
MHFRPLTDDDLADSPSWWGGRSLDGDRWRNDETRSAAALDGDVVVAAGAIWLSRVHEDRFWLEVVVDPERRRSGIGTALVGHLSTLRSRALPFMARGYVDDEAMRFADALGARTIQIVPPARAALDLRRELRPHADVQPLAGVARSHVETAFAAMYRWTHENWSPVRDGFEHALVEGLWDDLDADASAVAVDDSGGILALALTFVDTDPALIVAETTTRDQPGGEHLVEGCIRRAMASLAHRGLTLVDFDGHVSDPHFLPALSRLAPTGRWFRLVEIPAP